MRALIPVLTLSLLAMACGGLTPPGQAPATGEGATPGAVLVGEGPVPVTITSPEDESTVAVAEVEVRGTTVPNAIVTLNDEIVVADERGEFSATVLLDDGLNSIEIVVSDLDGNETFLVLTVTYDSEG